MRFVSETYYFEFRPSASTGRYLKAFCIINFLAFYPFFEDNRRMNEELDALEIKVSYLELKCDELNEVIVEQQKDMKKMKAQIEALEKKVLDLEEESGQDRPNRKPPHY